MDQAYQLIQLPFLRANEVVPRGSARLLPVFERTVQVTASDVATVAALCQQVEPEAVRYFLLTEHYGSPLSLRCERDADGVACTPQLVDAAHKVSHLYATKRRLCTLPPERIVAIERKAPLDVADVTARIGEALEADLHTPLSLVELTRFLVAVNALCDAALRKKGSIARSHRNEAMLAFEGIAELLMLGGESPSVYLDRVRNRSAKARGISKMDVETKIAARTAARARGDFAAADEVRAELSRLGVELLDSPSGTDWFLPDAT